MSGLNIKHRITESFSQSADRYDQNAAVQRAIGEQLIKDLQARQAMVSLDAQGCWLDLGCGSGYFSEHFANHFEAQGLALDIAFGMLKHTDQRMPVSAKVSLLNADAEALPLASESLDLIFSNFALQWCLNLPAALLECWRVLKPGGYCGLTIPGEGSLKELQTSWAALDTFDHVNRFYSQNDLKQVVRQCLPQNVALALSQQVYVDHHPDLKSLLKSLKSIGANTLTGASNRGLMGKQRFACLEENYEKYRQADGSLPLSYQVLTLIMNKPKP
ncbi:MAG TPA: malonyl-ACP O-methyltransferase BioC [Pseudomonadales bacterium]|nr:malonyl-ACP O-methyltransferase BioC [Pseudomonadales bacterium]